jgi:flavin reductase (DIM6/NTAB) family NADH-FMN oxidoreductase RutF
MKSFEPKKLKTSELHAFLLSAVAPRPISFASTIDKEGNVNLSPFSFFNVYSSKPPIMVFSSNRSGKTGDIKDTYKNIKEVPEVVINIVTYEMVQQTSLASVAYPRGVNEFIKAGFTMLPSENIAPPRVAESPVQFECKVNQVIELGQEGGAGNLFICEILKMHINENVLNDAGTKIDPLKMNQVGRCGDDYYIKLDKASLFEVPKPVSTIGIGVDALPTWVIKNHILSGNDLGMLGNVEAIPFEIVYDGNNENENTLRLKNAKELLNSKNVSEAWKVLIS